MAITEQYNGLMGGGGGGLGVQHAAAAMRQVVMEYAADTGVCRINLARGGGGGGAPQLDPCRSFEIHHDASDRVDVGGRRDTIIITPTVPGPAPPAAPAPHADRPPARPVQTRPPGHNAGGSGGGVVKGEQQQKPQPQPQPQPQPHLDENGEPCDDDQEAGPPPPPAKAEQKKTTAAAATTTTRPLRYGTLGGTARESSEPPAPGPQWHGSTHRLTLTSTRLQSVRTTTTASQKLGSSYPTAPAPAPAAPPAYPTAAPPPPAPKKPADDPPPPPPPATTTTTSPPPPSETPDYCTAGYEAFLLTNVRGLDSGSLGHYLDLLGLGRLDLDCLLGGLLGPCYPYDDAAAWEELLHNYQVACGQDAPPPPPPAGDGGGDGAAQSPQPPRQQQPPQVTSEGDHSGCLEACERAAVQRSNMRGGDDEDDEGGLEDCIAAAYNRRMPRDNCHYWTSPRKNHDAVAVKGGGKSSGRFQHTGAGKGNTQGDWDVFYL